LVYSQEEPDNKRNSITIEPLNLLLKTISLAYTRKIGDEYELRINPRVSFDSPKDNAIGDFALPKDPFWYYNSYALQIGMRAMLNKRIYIEPILSYKYASFDDRVLQTENPDGGTYDEFEKLSRQYNSGEIILRSGILVDENRFRFNFYYGLGYYLKYYHEEITEKWMHMYPIPGYYPIETDFRKSGISLHVGIELGYRF